MPFACSVATAQDEPTLLAAVEEARPDVVVTDVRMPPTGTDEGVRVATHLAAARPGIGVVIVSQYSERGWRSRVFDQGSENRGWVMKERVNSDGQLIRAVTTVHDGDRRTATSHGRVSRLALPTHSAGTGGS